jgi:hypothetical protein
MARPRILIENQVFRTSKLIPSPQPDLPDVSTIVYTDLDPDLDVYTAPFSYDLDLDNNAVIDFEIQGFEITSTALLGMKNQGMPGSVAVNIGGGNRSQKFDSGQDIGSSFTNWKGTGNPVAGLSTAFGFVTGDFIGDTAFIGVKFPIDGNTHYGWVHVTISNPMIGGSATVLGYAYNAKAEEKILAGQTE